MDIPISPTLQAIVDGVTERFDGSEISAADRVRPTHVIVVGATTATATTDGQVELGLLVLNSNRGSSHYSVVITEKVDRS